MTAKLAVPAPLDDDALLDVDGAAKLLGYGRWWVIEHTTGKKEPKLPCVRIGRLIKFRRSDLRDFIEAHAVKA